MVHVENSRERSGSEGAIQANIYHIDFGIRMSHIANNRPIFQFIEGFSCDGMFTSRCSDKNVNLFDDFFQSNNFESFHTKEKTAWNGTILAKRLTRLVMHISDRFPSHKQNNPFHAMLYNILCRLHLEYPRRKRRTGPLHPLVLQYAPYPQTTACFPPNKISVHRFIPSIIDSRHRYKLSNFVFVTLSLTFIAGAVNVCVRHI